MIWLIFNQELFPFFPPPSGHGLLFKTKYEKSLLWKSSQSNLPNIEMKAQKGEMKETRLLKEPIDGVA